MLAKNPIIQTECWNDISPDASEYLQGGKVVGNIYRYFGLWYAQFIPADAKSPTTREDLHSGLGMPSRIAAKVIVENAIAAGLKTPKRRPLRPRPMAPDADDEHRLTKFDVLQHSWVR